MIDRSDIEWFARQGVNPKILGDLQAKGSLPIQFFLGGSDWQRLNRMESDPETLEHDGPIKHWFEPLQGLELIEIDESLTVTITAYGQEIIRSVNG